MLEGENGKMYEPMSLTMCRLPGSQRCPYLNNCFFERRGHCFGKSQLDAIADCAPPFMIWISGASRLLANFRKR